MHTICIYPCNVNQSCTKSGSVSWECCAVASVDDVRGHSKRLCDCKAVTRWSTVRNDLVTAWSRGLPGLAKKWLGQSWSKTVTWQSKVFVKHLKMRWFNDIQLSVHFALPSFFDHKLTISDYLFTVDVYKNQWWTSSITQRDIMGRSGMANDIWKRSFWEYGWGLCSAFGILE
jgi:hypothetical protein